MGGLEAEIAGFEGKLGQVLAGSTRGAGSDKAGGGGVRLAEQNLRLLSFGLPGQKQKQSQ